MKDTEKAGGTGRSTSRRAVLAGTASVGASLTAGCLDSVPVIGGSDQDSSVVLEDQTIRVGSLMATSGPVADITEPAQQAAELAINELEQSAVGVDYELLDTEADPAQAVSQAQTLATDDYPCVFGPTTSGEALQTTQQVLIPNEITSCTYSATTPTLSIVNDRGYSYRTVASDAFQSRVAAQVATEEHGANTAVTLYQDDTYGRQLARAFAGAFEGTITESIPYNPTTSGIEEMERAVNLTPDLLFFVGFAGDTTDMFNHYYDMDTRLDTVLVTDGMRDREVAAGASRLLTEVFGTAPLATGPRLRQFERLYESEYGEPPEGAPFLANAYDAMAVLILAQAAADEQTGAGVRNQMREVTTGPGDTVVPGNLAQGVETALNGNGRSVRYRGASGEITFDGQGDIGSAGYEQFTFNREGSIETVGEYTV